MNHLTTGQIDNLTRQYSEALDWMTDKGVVENNEVVGTDELNAHLRGNEELFRRLVGLCAFDGQSSGEKLPWLAPSVAGLSMEALGKLFDVVRFYFPQQGVTCTGITELPFEIASPARDGNMNGGKLPIAAISLGKYQTSTKICGELAPPDTIFHDLDEGLAAPAFWDYLAFIHQGLTTPGAYPPGAFGGLGSCALFEETANGSGHLQMRVVEGHKIEDGFVVGIPRHEYIRAWIVSLAHGENVEQYAHHPSIVSVREGFRFDVD